MNVAIVSDTHIPTRADALPDWVEERVEAADHTIHAGDFVSGEAYRNVRTLAGSELTAVRGNMDSVDAELPAVATVTLGGVEFVVTHGTGNVANYESRVAGVVQKHGGTDAVGVCGHTHEFMDRKVDGVRLLNPGSATGAAPADEVSMLTATVEGGDLDVTPHRR